MSKLDELIKELCPNGVEYKKTNSFCEIKTGKGITSKDSSENGEYPIISGGKTPMGYYDKYNREGNTVTISRVGANAGFVLFLEEKFYLNDKCFSVIPFEEYKNTIIPKYLYYFFKNIENQIVALQSEGGVPTINTQKVGNLEIPVPPLPVQEEIVRILDTFTSLTAELTAELTARRKQYEYYRDSRLTRDTKVEVKKLGDFATITRGGNFQKKDFVERGLPCIHYGQMYTHFGTWTEKTLTFVAKDVFNKSKQAQPNDIVMAVTSDNVDDVCKCTAWVGKDPIAVSGHTAIIHHNQNAKYLSYYFQSSVFYKQKVKLAHGTKVIEVTPDKLNDITIPLPSLDVQERIVNVLDNFDSICTDLKIGLPAEIEARKKQYEYYRDLLLTFASSGNTILSEQNRTDEIKLLQYVFGYAIVRLGEIAKIKNGKDYKALGSGNIPVYGSGGIMTYVDKSVYNKPTVLIPRKGSLANLFYVDSEFWNVDTIFYTEINQEIVVPKYLFYLLLKEHLENLNKAGGVPSLTQEILNKVVLLVPSCEEQERIVKILDRFDSLCNDISSGLPAEIEARQKQYEYYRDKLLTFEKKKV